VAEAGAADRSDAFVFIGATGDLAFKQIFPAIQGLIRDDGWDLPIIGVARSGDLAALQARARASLEANGGVDEAAFAVLSRRLAYVKGSADDPDTFQKLREALGEARHPLHYLAIPPSLFTTVVRHLDGSGCAKDARVIVEKPFGHDLASARALNACLHEVFPESAIFRIDHYLGKEQVQNILYFRFANRFLEPVWSGRHVASVQITMSEDFGVSDRGAFYDATGVIRDVVQNHLFQVISILAMEPPAGHDPETLRNEKFKVLDAIRPIQPADIVRGQFQGYRDVKGVAPDSKVATYVAMRLHVDTWRWGGVPFALRTGKCLPVTATEVLVEFKRPPLDVFREREPAGANYLRLRLTPDMSISLGARAKKPGERMVGEPIELYAAHQSGDERPPYERLIGDAAEGDQTLFARQDTVEAAWRAVDAALDPGLPLHPYEPGTWGPAEADKLAPDGHWHVPMARPPTGEPSRPAVETSAA
jgi:glucose-6-phosphate 1-dehydrogenase